MIMAKQYCSISNGSACTSKNYSPSYVLKAMGIPEEEIECSVRISWGPDTSENELKENLVKLIEIAKQIKGSCQGGNMSPKMNMGIVYENNLDTDKFARMFNNKAQSYKFYWFEAILNLTMETDEDLSFEDVIDLDIRHVSSHI